MSVHLYFRYQRSLEALDESLARDGLTNPKYKLVRFRTRLVESKVGFAILLLGSGGILAMGVWFHSKVETSYPLSQFLSERASHMTAEVLQDRWWAGHGHRLPAAWWIAVGSAGTLASLLHARLHVRFAWAMTRQKRHFPAAFLYSHDDPDHGWGAFRALLNLTTLGAANFAVAMLSIAFMVVGPRGSNTAVAVLSAFVLVGIVANLFLVLGLSSFVRHCYTASWMAERTRISAPQERRRRGFLRSRGSPSGHDPAVRLALLDGQKGFPIQGIWKRAPAILALSIANATLVLAMFQWAF
ncbi:hypothetical protein NLS1_21390 [Nocardioides sp. LS1]|nr:hypothetical protein NLS1_21390 [Nocardioides sp. LS1]